MKIRILSVALCALFALSACGGSKSGSTATNEAASSAPMEAASAAPSAEASAGAASGTIPDCGAVQAVWVNLKTKVYHESNDPLYGHTKHGEYMCPAQAKKQGYRPAGGKHHGSSSM